MLEVQDITEHRGWNIFRSPAPFPFDVKFFVGLKGVSDKVGPGPIDSVISEIDELETKRKESETT